MNDNTFDIDIAKLVDEAKKAVQLYATEIGKVHPFDLKETLLEIRDLDENVYLQTLKSIPNELLAEVIAELPVHLQEETSDLLGIKKLAKITSEMDTDDAADFLKSIRDRNFSKAENILEKINPTDQKIIRNLISYQDELAGAYMQTELFSVKENEEVGASIGRLRSMKKSGDIHGINQVFIIDNNENYICSIGLEELILLDPNVPFKVALEAEDVTKFDLTANHFDNIKDVVEKVGDYNLAVIPVIDDAGKLLGRITSDDIYDLIEAHATEDMYSMAGLKAEVEQSDNLRMAAKQRALWLGVNLLTAIAASAVVALFDSTIQSFVSLAILMPIVASMGGNAGTQSLTVTVRQLSIGEIGFEDAVDTIKKEVSLALMNGLFFAVLIGIFSYFWFQLPYLGIVIALSTIVNLFVAGLSGALIPLLLDKVKIDPAIASTVILTTITDIVGFFSFLGLAKLLMTH